MFPNDPASETSPETKTPKYGRVWIALVLALGLGLRLAAMMWGQAFCYGSQEDCLDAYRVATHFADGEARAQYLGQPNFNERSKLPGPLWAMFCAGGVRMFGSMRGAVWAIVLVNTAAIYLTYLLAVRTVGVPAALWGSLLMATSPAAIEFSVIAFNPVVMPFLGGCVYLALWRVVKQDRSPAAVWLFFLPLMMLQFHMSGLMLIAPIILVLLLATTRVNTRWLLAGVVAGLALYIPYVRGEMAHGWENTHGMLTGAHHKYSLEAFKVFTSPASFLVNFWGGRWKFQPGEYKELGVACFGSYGVLLAFNIFSVIVALLLILGTFASLRVALRGFWKQPRATFARETGLAYLTIVFFVPLLTSLLEGKRFHGRYCLVLLPPFFALAGLSAVKLLSLSRARRIFMTLFALAVGANVVVVLSVFRYQAKCIEQGAIFLPTFEKLESVYQALKAHAGATSPIRVDDQEYMQTLPSRHPTTGYLRQIHQYVEIRELQKQIQTRGKGPIIIFKMIAANRVQPDNQVIGYQGHGIALVASRAKPTVRSSPAN